jgi:hypothetical protein
MMSIRIGPLALPAAPLLLLLSTWFAVWLADRVAVRVAPSPATAGRSAGAVLVHSALFGLFVARVAHVALHLAAYRAEPWAIVDLRDGGWNAWAGLAGGLTWVGWRAWRHANWRRALAAAQARHPDVVFVFANQGERPEAVRRYLATERLELSHVLLDPPSRLGPALGSGGLPTTVLFDRQGRRVDAHMGALNSAALAARLGAVTAP